jgi:hypothetical protein
MSQVGVLIGRVSETKLSMGDSFLITSCDYFIRVRGAIKSGEFLD